MRLEEIIAEMPTGVSLVRKQRLNSYPHQIALDLNREDSGKLKSRQHVKFLDGLKGEQLQNTRDQLEGNSQSYRGLDKT